MIDFEDTSTVIRLTTGDAELLLPALVRRGASFQLTARGRVDLRGIGAAEVARIAASYNARVDDLETVRFPDTPGVHSRGASSQLPGSSVDVVVSTRD